MKKLLTIIFCSIVLIGLVSCSGAGRPLGASKGGIDVDLTRMSSTMVYSEVFDMVYTPQEYVGKTVKMKGDFYVMYDEENNRIRYACVIQDATQCCSQGIEFKFDEEPDELPEGYSEVVVVGTFDTYKDASGEEICYLKNAEFV